MATKGEQIYEGKAKILYRTEDPDQLIQYFKDDATAFNAAKKGTIEQKGVFNNKISTKIFEYLESQGISTHYVKSLSDREMLIKTVEIIQVEVIVRNVSAGSLCRLLGIDEGIEMEPPVMEYCYKKDELGDPLINEDHIRILNIATSEELAKIRDCTFRINKLMKEFFDKLNLQLIDFKLEFGRHKGEIILADEISPDTCRLWEKGTKQRFDKDRFRHDLGNVVEAYQEVFNRVSS